MGVNRRLPASPDLSSGAATASGRCRPSDFGMCRRDGSGRYAPDADTPPMLPSVQILEIALEVCLTGSPRQPVPAGCGTL